MRDGEEIRINIQMKDNAQPIAQKLRRVPYQLTEPLKKRLEEFEENDIIEPVPEHEAITWCSPLVVQPKPKNPKDIRACLDLRLVNKSMLRTRQVQAPITEDFITEFKRCTVFSKLHLNHAWLSPIPYRRPVSKNHDVLHTMGQLSIQETPKTYSTRKSQRLYPVSRECWTCNRDNIMIGGLDWEDHNTNLRAVLQRIEDHNLTLRKEKCEFGKTMMNFPTDTCSPQKDWSQARTRSEPYKNAHHRRPKKS